MKWAGCLSALLCLTSWSATAAAQRSSVQWSVGGMVPLSFNSSWAGTTSTDFRLGAGIALRSDFFLDDLPISVLASFSKNQLLSQRINGADNPAICRERENWFATLFSFPGACTRYETRLALLYRWRAWQAGVSLIYQHISDFTFNGSRVYNTRWSAQGFGLISGYSHGWDRFSLHILAHLDYLPLSQTLLSSTVADSEIKSLNTGIIVYAMYGIF